MLILGRRKGESFKIKLPDGRIVEILLAEINGYRSVRLGVTAPADVVVYRSEISDRFEASIDNHAEKLLT